MHLVLPWERELFCELGHPLASYHASAAKPGRNGLRKVVQLTPLLLTQREVQMITNTVTLFVWQTPRRPCPDVRALSVLRQRGASDGDGRVGRGDRACVVGVRRVRLCRLLGGEGAWLGQSEQATTIFPYTIVSPTYLAE